MADSVAGVVLAAGAGTRLRPLSLLRPKALCPVGNVPLVDLALDRVRTVAGDVAVNVHHGRDAMLEHLGGRVHVSVEDREALGTAGALGHLRDWLAGRAAVVVNADAWCPGSLAPFLDGWDGEHVRLLVVGDDVLTPTSAVAAALLPWAAIAPLAPTPTGLYEMVWREAQAAGELEVVRHDGPFVDCGTPRQYLEANLLSSGGANVVAADAQVDGDLDRCVVWSGARVRAGETLRCAIRPATGITILVR
jgi:N-acetyl-alpha-D-muramate 1-phosphate uridylyltransferase